MISDIVNAIDHVIQLLQKRADDRRHLFLDQIEPLFTDLSAIQSDYRQIFDAIETQLEDPSLTHTEVTHRLRKRRRQLEHIRDKAKALGQVLQSNAELPEIAQLFFQSICRYFSIPSEEGELYSSRATPAQTLIEALDIMKDEPEEFRSLLHAEVRRVSGIIEREWQHMLAMYAQARVELLR
jgi:hypothetical protein